MRYNIVSPHLLSAHIYLCSCTCSNTKPSYMLLHLLRYPSTHRPHYNINISTLLESISSRHPLQGTMRLLSCTAFYYCALCFWLSFHPSTAQYKINAPNEYQVVEYNFITLLFLCRPLILSHQQRSTVSSTFSDDLRASEMLNQRQDGGLSTQRSNFSGMNSQSMEDYQSGRGEDMTSGGGCVF